MSTATVARERLLSRQRVQWWKGWPYWLALPTMAYILVFLAWPTVQAFGLAFRANGHWTLANVQGMLHDPQFSQAMIFTLLLVAVLVPLQFLLALAMALLADAKLRGRSIFLFIFLLPLAVSDLAAGIAWLSIFQQQGYLNTVLQDIGLIHAPVLWNDPTHPYTLLLLEVVAAELWRSTALITIILFAGLQGISRDYHEAAEVFGAGFFQRMRYVILPMLKPTIQAALVLRIVLAFEAFATVIAITGAGAHVLAEQSWSYYTNYSEQGIAAAYAALILVLSLALAAGVFAALRTPRERLAR
jgi:multiple sugar transport system permease protein